MGRRWVRNFCVPTNRRRIRHRYWYHPVSIVVLIVVMVIWVVVDYRHPRRRFTRCRIRYGRKWHRTRILPNGNRKYKKYWRRFNPPPFKNSVQIVRPSKRCGSSFWAAPTIPWIRPSLPRYPTPWKKKCRIRMNFLRWSPRPWNN